MRVNLLEMANNLEQSLGFNLHIAAFMLKQTLKASLKEANFDITTEEFVLLMLISEEGIEQIELQQKLYKDKTNITRLLDRLVAKDLVTRQPSHVSRRQQIVNLTDAGQSMQVELAQLLQQFSKQALKNIEPKDQQLTVKNLQQFMKNLS